MAEAPIVSRQVMAQTALMRVNRLEWVNMLIRLTHLSDLSEQKNSS
jgi:hypothetical protein